MQAKAFVPEEHDLENLLQQVEQLLASERLAGAANREFRQPRAEETGPATPNLAPPAEDRRRIIATTEANDPDPIARLRTSIAARVLEEEKHRFGSRLARFLFFCVLLLAILTAGATFFAGRLMQREATSSQPEATAAIPPVVTEGQANPALGVPARRQRTPHQ
jgi:hypothetical protein